MLPPAGAEVLAATDSVERLAGRYVLETVNTTPGLPESHSLDSLILRVPTAAERHVVIPGFGGKVQADYYRDLMGERVWVVDGEAYRTTVEVEGAQLVIGPRYGFDVSPRSYDMQWKNARAFGGRWDDWLAGIGVVHDSSGRRVKRLFGYFCAWRLE